MTKISPLFALAGSAAQTDGVLLDGAVDTRVETGYLSSSGALIDTRPSVEHQLDLTLHLAEYGRLTACGWVISALHGGRDKDHRRAEYYQRNEAEIFTFGLSYFF